MSYFFAEGSKFYFSRTFAAAKTLSAIFSNGYALGNVGMLGMATSQPSLTLASADVSTDPVGAAVLVGAAAYVVAAHEPDGTGVSRLLLEVAS